MDLNLKDVQKTYDDIFVSLNKPESSSTDSSTGVNIAKHRRLTIARTMAKLLILYPEAQPYKVWKMIEKAHMISFIDKMIKLPEKPLDTSELIDFVLDSETLTVMTSAAQSWKRASGVAWEEFLQRSLNLSDASKEIVILNAPEMKALLEGETFKNRDGFEAKLSIPEKDKDYAKFIRKVLDDKNFDLFLIYFFPVTQEWRLFGLIQCKTSIRDRLKINMKSSEEAMQHHLWSILIAMDPDGFISNGGQYNIAAKQSWNGFYILNNNERRDGSIYYGNLQTIQNIIRCHCLELFIDLFHNTDSINEIWRPSK